MEMISDEEEFSPEDLKRMRADFDEEFGSDATPAATQKPAEQPDESNLESLAKEFGFSGPSGVRQYINRILKRLGFAAGVLDDSSLETLMNLAVPEYISEMESGNYIDEEDVADLKQAPNIVRGMPSFQYFFVSGFILPAYREFSRNANNSVRKSMEAAGIPKSAQDTVFNQATGLAAKDPDAIKQKLSKSAESGEIDRSDYTSIMAAAREIAMKSDSGLPETEDFVATATSRWQSLSRSRRQSVLRKALQQTLDEM